MAYSKDAKCKSPDKCITLKFKNLFFLKNIMTHATKDGKEYCHHSVPAHGVKTCTVPVGSYLLVNLVAGSKDIPWGFDGHRVIKADPTGGYYRAECGSSYDGRLVFKKETCWLF